MNSKRMYFVMLGLIVVLLAGLVGGAYGVNTLLASKSQSLLKLKTQSQVLANEQTSLVTAKKEVQKYSSLEEIAQSVVPQDKDQAQAVLEISNLAAQSGISQLSSITFPASTLGGIPGSTIKTNNGLTQLTPVKGIPGVYELQITIAQTSDNPVPYTQFTTFLSKLEQNRRTAQVSSITLEPSPTNAQLVAFNLIVNVFIKPT